MNGAIPRPGWWVEPSLAPGRSGWLDEHLYRELAGPGPWPGAEQADVLALTEALPTAEAAERLRWLLRHFPGCALASVPFTERGHPAGRLVGARDGVLSEARPLPPPPAPADWHRALLSFLHAWLTAGQPIGRLAKVTLHTARGSTTVRLTPG